MGMSGKEVAEKHWSEADELQRLLKTMSPEQAMSMGVVMGIMRKGDAVNIARLLEEVDSQRSMIEALSDALQEAEERNGGEG
jgi:uncharacterized membrane protein